MLKRKISATDKKNIFLYNARSGAALRKKNQKNLSNILDISREACYYNVKYN